VVAVSLKKKELGHAWARKWFRAPWSEITLYGFGGLCSGPGKFTRWESVGIAAAGPAASLTLGGLVWLLLFTPGIRDPWTGFFIGRMLWVNVGWAVFNLLPILPLDGGHIFAGLAGPRHSTLVYQVGMILAVLMAVAGLLFLHSLFMAILFGMLAYGNWQRMRGQRPGFV